MDSFVAHFLGVGEFAGAGGEGNLAVRIQDRNRRYAPLQGHAIGSGDLDVAVEPADVDLDHLEELRDERLKKLQLLKEEGIDPYPISSFRDTEIRDFLENFDKTKSEVVITGRVRALRVHGKAAFFDLEDM